MSKKITIIGQPEGVTKSVTPEQFEQLKSLELVFLDKEFGQNMDQSQWCFWDDENEEKIDKILNKSSLDELRDGNSGYNPEPVDNSFDVVKHDKDNGQLILVRKGESKTDKSLQESWLKVDAANEEEFIICFSKVFGVVYKDQFFIREADFNAL